VGTTEIAADAVTAAKIATGAVGTTEIAANAVTFPKLPAATASRLLSRRSGSGGDYEPITIGSGLTMSSGGELSASGGGGGAAPLTRAIAYVDLSASGSGAAVGNGIAFNDLSTAYAAVIAWRAANSNAPATIWLAPGTYTEASWTAGWAPGTDLVGSGNYTTFVNITGAAIDFYIRGWGFTLTANITAPAGFTGSEGVEFSEGGGTGGGGNGLTVELVGNFILGASIFTAGAGGTGGHSHHRARATVRHLDPHLAQADDIVFRNEFGDHSAQIRQEAVRGLRTVDDAPGQHRACGDQARFHSRVHQMNPRKFSGVNGRSRSTYCTPLACDPVGSTPATDSRTTPLAMSRSVRSAAL
jgi:hypothetical protein